MAAAAPPPPLTIDGVITFLTKRWDEFQREKAVWESDQRKLQATIDRVNGEKKALEVLYHELNLRNMMLEKALIEERKKNLGLAPEAVAPPTESTSTTSEAPLVVKAATVRAPPSHRVFDYNSAVLSGFMTQFRLTGTGRESSAVHRPALGLKTFTPPSPITNSSSTLNASNPETRVPSGLVPQATSSSSATATPSSTSTPTSAGGSSSSSSSAAAAAATPATTTTPAAAATGAAAAATPASAPPSGGGNGGNSSLSADEAAAKAAEEEFAARFANTKLGKKMGRGTAKGMIGMSGGAGFEDPPPYAASAGGPDNNSVTIKASNSGSAAAASTATATATASSASSATAGAGESGPKGGAGGGKEKGSAAANKDTMARGAEPSPAGDDELSRMTMDEGGPSAKVEELGEAGNKLWRGRRTFRSHFDGVRCVAFNSTAAGLLSASEDGTVKYWNVKGAAFPSGQKASPLDEEPLMTFRGHRGPVFSCDVNGELGMGVSGSADGTVRFWSLPALSTPLYEPCGRIDYNQIFVLAEHTDCVWSVKFHPLLPMGASASSDGSVMLWSVAGTESKVTARLARGDDDNPTSVAFMATDLTKLLVSYRSSSVVVWDINTAQVVSTIADPDSAALGVTAQLNGLVSHPTVALALGAAENGRLRYYDLNAGSLTHSMTAHQKSVSSLCVDPSGMYLMTGGHDASVRYWQILERKCVQETGAHRHKFEEAVHSVAYHPTEPLCASGGADSTVRIWG